MSASLLRLHHITSISDPFLPPWLDLFQTAFPLHEQIQISSLLGALTSREEDRAVFTAALLEDKFAGMALHQRREDVAVLWYLAVHPDFRGQGLGSQLYGMIRAGYPEARALVYEIERPDQARTAGDREQAERRIAFYRRLGGRVALNLRFWMSVGDWQPKTLMYLVIHPLQPMNPDDALQIFRQLFSDGIESLTEPLVLR